ncbi:hypothetical protein CVO77_19270 [Sphingopyxis lindanitolerans]|uniref:Uncharacterized protein n=1 Tax=Sphingopyxis lindanitolerans TaxID=2054227 RepID=A0A2S8B417_9SPHN|nr:hypothetical protein CVO77_19270 [Sphingopyxis lindanitolerans]
MGDRAGATGGVVVAHRDPSRFVGEIAVADHNRANPGRGAIDAQGYRTGAGRDIGIADRDRAIARGDIAEADRDGSPILSRRAGADGDGVAR